MSAHNPGRDEMCSCAFMGVRRGLWARPGIDRGRVASWIALGGGVWWGFKLRNFGGTNMRAQSGEKVVEISGEAEFEAKIEKLTMMMVAHSPEEQKY